MLDATGTDRAVVAGLSMAANWALELAAYEQDGAAVSATNLPWKRVPHEPGDGLARRTIGFIGNAGSSTDRLPTRYLNDLRCRASR